MEAVSGLQSELLLKQGQLWGEVRLHRAWSTQVLKIFKDWEWTNNLGNLILSWLSTQWRNFFLYPVSISLVSTCITCLFSSQHSLALFYWQPPCRYWELLLRPTLKPPLLQAKQELFSQPFLKGCMYIWDHNILYIMPTSLNNTFIIFSHKSECKCWSSVSL